MDREKKSFYLFLIFRIGRIKVGKEEVENKRMMWPLTWLNKNVINAMLQWDIYIYISLILKNLKVLVNLFLTCLK